MNVCVSDYLKASFLRARSHHDKGQDDPYTGLSSKSSRRPSGMWIWLPAGQLCEGEMKCGTRAELLWTVVDPFLLPAVLPHHTLCADLTLFTWEVELLWGGKNIRPCVLKMKQKRNSSL